VIYAFQGGSDGNYPFDGLVNVGGTLYGTTYNGGTAGTVFKVTIAGAEAVVHSFKGGRDGGNPGTRLKYVGGTLFGTTIYGGGSTNCEGGCGTVFSVTPAGAEKVLHAFKGGKDGEVPGSKLISVNGILYGTTSGGGGGSGSGCGIGGISGCGTVFSVDPTTGAEAVVYSFKGGPDGASPLGHLVDVGGILYGVTHYGGNSNCGGGCGTVFAVTP
jgi:uncharacterized repeat protein (TIGR03803 family)